MSEQIKKSSRLAWAGWLAGAVLAALGVAGAVWIASHAGHKRGAGGEGPGESSHGGGHAHEEKGGSGGHDHAAHASEIVVPPEGQRRWGVRLEVAAKKALRPTFEVPARVTFNQEKAAQVGSPLRGRVTEIKARLGDEAKKGDVLLVVDSPELGEAQADYLAKIAAAKAAEPKVEVARNLFQRGHELQQSGRIVSRSEVDRRELDLREAEATLQHARSAIQAGEQRLRLLGMTSESIADLRSNGEVRARLDIRSPMDGQIVQREVTQGGLVDPDRPTLLVVADLRSVWVLADVPEARLRDVEKGARVFVRAAGSGEGLEGVVSYISPVVHRDTRAGEVRVEVAEATGRLLPGMFVRAEITAASRGDHHEPVVAVPEAAIQTIEGGSCVFVPVKGEDNTFTKRAVAVGRPVSGLVPVYSGLDEGESFVAAGTFIFKAELGKGSAAHQH